MLPFVLAASAYSANFYIDPKNGEATNDGSRERPWRGLQEVLDRGLVETQTWDSLPAGSSSKLVAMNPRAPVKGGDTIWLTSGSYGDLKIDDMYNSDAVVIAALDGHRPEFHSIRIRSGAHWTLKGLHISAEYGSGTRPGRLVSIESHGFRGPVRDVSVENCVLSSASDTSSWTADDWNQRACDGIGADGTRITLRNNQLRNVNFGLSVGASHSFVEGNVIENFSGDGMRGLGNHTVFQNNTVKNCYDVNDNHDDGFQSWSRGPGGKPGSGVVKGIVLRGNTIINFEDPRQPLRGPLQGIGCFDGMYEDWVIENNVIIVDHWHGITLLGATGCRIVNNTVLDLSEGRPGPPWIQIGNHKTGAASIGNVVRNNLTTDLKAADGTTVDHNQIIEDPRSLFTDVRLRDLALRKGSSAIDAGTRDLAPELDIAGTRRPQGAAVDVGAYEFVDE